MNAGTKVRHKKHGPGVVVGPAFTPLAVLVKFDKHQRGWVKVIRVARLHCC